MAGETIMNLGKLISRLQSEDPNREVPIGFCNPHSHRGDYSELAFTVDLGSSIGSLLSAAVYAIDRDFEGYKGGTYRMTLMTPCYLTTDSSRSGIEIDEELLDRMIRSNAVDRAWQRFQKEIEHEIEIDEALLNRILAHDLQVFNDANEIDCVCKDCKPVKTIATQEEYEVTDDEQAGYVLAMRLLQSDLDLDDVEMGAIAQFTQPEVMRRVLRATK